MLSRLLVFNDRTAVFFNMTRAEFFCDSIYRYYETGPIRVCGVSHNRQKNIEGVQVIVFVYVDLIQYIPFAGILFGTIGEFMPKPCKCGLKISVDNIEIFHYMRSVPSRFRFSKPTSDKSVSGTSAYSRVYFFMYRYRVCRRTKRSIRVILYCTIFQCMVFLIALPMYHPEMRIAVLGGLKIVMSCWKSRTSRNPTSPHSRKRIVTGSQRKHGSCAKTAAATTKTR